MDTDLILLDDNFYGIGILKADIDFEIGNIDSLNNFEMLTTPIDARGLYIDGTEYGGIFEYEHGFSDENKQTLKGWTWRGLLTQGIIIPPSGSDYYTVSGDANTILADLLEDYLGGFFKVPSEEAGITISSYQFQLYTTYLEGIMDMLESVGARLKITATKDDVGSPVSVYVEAVAIETVEGSFNADSPVQLEYTFNNMGINHLVCMGQGELQERTRVDLYTDNTGAISTTQYYEGFNERTAYYDYASAESETDLTDNGKQRLLETCSSNLVSVHAKTGLDLEVGDYIRATYKGQMVIAPIIQKILSIQQGAILTDYKVKGDI